MAVADGSGTVNTDPLFLADRQAIINHVTAYASHRVTCRAW